MRWELAKELKEAGFPLVDVKGVDYHERQYGWYGIDGIDYRIPTLEELIDQCTLRSQSFLAFNQTAGGWTASGSRKTEDAEHPTLGVEEHGRSLIEAVSRLWLALVGTRRLDGPEAG